MTIIFAVFFFLLLTLPVISGVLAYHLISRFQERNVRDQRVAKDLLYVATLNRRSS